MIEVKIFKQFVPFFLLVIWMFSCSEKDDVLNKFSDENLIHIYTLKDKRDTEGLIPFFSHENKKYRAEAALAFGSIQDSSELSKLELLLDDADENVRLSAAFAIGQTGNQSSVPGLKKKIKIEPSENVLYELLLAYGSCVDSLGLEFLDNYETDSDRLIEAKAWGLYRAGLRNIFSEAGTATMADLLGHLNSRVQLATSNYFMRVRIGDIHNYFDKLNTALNMTKTAEVKSNLARAIGKIDSEEAQNSLIEVLNSENSDLVFVNTLNSLNPLYEKKYLNAVKKHLISETPQVAFTASNLLDKSMTLEAEDLKGLISMAKGNRAKAILYRKLMNVNDLSIVTEIIKEIESSNDSYYIGELLKALASDKEQVEYIAEKTFSSKAAYVKTSGIAALQSMLDKGYGSKGKMAAYFKRAIESKDIGLIWSASQTLSDTTNGLKNQYESFSFLAEAKNNLVLPIDAEAMIAIQNVIDVFNGNNPSNDFQNPYNNPIDWDHIETIPKDQKVIIHTEKGDIFWQLNVEESPGTVEFFLRLVKKGFYDGLTFHRVVPNFVAQGGCPRGDGFGGTPESIRSEFGLRRYKTGSVGVASAGKDTESCQFFITHSPTPHLDGRYTIFAEVVDGMEVAQMLDVGDKINSIEIL